MTELLGTPLTYPLDVAEAGSGYGS